MVIYVQASCLAASLLGAKEGERVLDMCAAPGMKSLQLAGMVGREGHVLAVERDQRRFSTLQELLATADATNVTAICKDVLTLTDTDVGPVDCILVDPSCSGSGMTDRLY